jgi:SAM-dependent methyltransferase
MKLPRLVKEIGKRVVQATPVLRRHVLTSTDYKVLGGAEEAREAQASSPGWLASRTAARQERAYRNLIAAMKRGEPRLDFTVAAEAAAAAGLARPSLIEIGCGSGYYSDIFSTLLPGGVTYTGIDYSAAMIDRARAQYPALQFDVGDATRLPYGDAHFDIAFNGVSLMHIVDYAAAIREMARVASRSCILHTVPVFDDYRTTYLRKYAYGGAVVEIVFARAELMSLCERAGLHLERTWPCIPYDVSHITGHRSATETYLFSKKRRELAAQSP